MEVTSQCFNRTDKSFEVTKPSTETDDELKNELNFPLTSSVKERAAGFKETFQVGNTEPDIVILL
jgi:hypothetical protein